MNPTKQPFAPAHPFALVHKALQLLLVPGCRLYINPDRTEVQFVGDAMGTLILDYTKLTVTVDLPHMAPMAAPALNRYAGVLAALSQTCSDIVMLMKDCAAKEKKRLAAQLPKEESQPSGV